MTLLLFAAFHLPLVALPVVYIRADRKWRREARMGGAA